MVLYPWFKPEEYDRVVASEESDDEDEEREGYDPREDEDSEERREIDYKFLGF